MRSALSSSSSDAQVEVVAAAGRHRMVTRALIKGRSPLGQLDGPVGGVLRCICTAYLVSTQETLLECHRCRNWCHPACVGVDHAELRRYQVENSFVCPFCTGMHKRLRRESQSPAPRQPPLRLREVPDRLPFGSVMQLRHLLRIATRAAHEAGFVVVDLPVMLLTATMEKECLECCEEAIKEATFSDQYPAYCLKEVRERTHPYVQGTLLRCTQTGRVVSMVLSNGMDVYGNLRHTITQLKSGINRGLIDRRHQTAFMASCAKLTDISDFVHITLSATHRDYQRRGLARILMVIDLLKWALRGRTRAYLNMALEKRVVDSGTRLECVASPASRRLYESFGFRDVYPRFDRETDEARWTPKEVDMGRVMAHMNFVEDVVQIAMRYEADGAKADARHGRATAVTGTRIRATSSPSPPAVKKRLSLLAKRG
ncbi:transferase [Trypanosoma rangeli]|uniref:Transferase n=1 Tax=Trypanosoma rangeli TaxID=5698 RepID=A0A422NQ11_TRYRA|nr:transferase [Trypanosoma rangeli]RNF07590.1 transferase [Trypanosoma rangeli]|eukprot:RNF07590.1 transferase [Trypanosoma rangeli]